MELPRIAQSTSYLILIPSLIHHFVCDEIVHISLRLLYHSQTHKSTYPRSVATL